MLGACRFCVAISQDLPARAAQSSLVACYYDILILVHHSTFKLIAFRITICFTSFVIMWSYHGVMSSIVIVLVVLLPQVSSSQPGAASHLMGPQLTGSCGEEVGLSRFRGLGFRGLGFRGLGFCGVISVTCWIVHRKQSCPARSGQVASMDECRFLRAVLQ